MAELIDSLDAIGGRYRALLCDLWGCYHDGIRPFPEAVAALRRYRAEGGLVLMLTNAPRPVVHVEDFLAQMGAPPDSFDAILSSGQLCQDAIRTGAYGAGFHYVGPARDRMMLDEAGYDAAPLDAAAAILCTGLRDEARETPADYAAEIAGWVARGLPMLCANPDIVVDKGTARLWCAGALARDMERAGGTVHWFGKPRPGIYAASLDALGRLAGRAVAPAEVLAIGDGIATDVAGATAAGIDSVFVTGGIAAEAFGPDPLAPDPGRLATFLAAERAAPAYAMARLR